MSDVSDADPNDMAALLGDLDDLDASILGGAKKKTPAAVTTKPATKTGIIEKTSVHQCTMDIINTINA